MKREATRRSLRGPIISTSAVVFVFALWEISGRLGWSNTLLLPPPSEILATAADLLTHGYGSATLLTHFGISLARALGAFAVAIAAGVPIGLSMGMIPDFNALLSPFVQFLRPLPKLALIPLVILWFGIGELSKFVLIFLSAFLTITVGTAAAVGNMRPQRIKAARSLGSTGFNLFRRVILPSVLPEIFLSIRLGVGIGWTTLIAAEMIASTTGLGWMITNAGSYLRTDIVMLGILILGTTGYALDVALLALQKVLAPWAGKE
jgi:taurine transport system permease protein